MCGENDECILTKRITTFLSCRTGTLGKIPTSSERLTMQTNASLDNDFRGYITHGTAFLDYRVIFLESSF